MPELESSRDALTEDALNSLVHQFSDPLCFYRELVQNALDAGSRDVSVTLAHEDGVTTITVRDHGEGMTREIIDTELTRLFTSSKENDMTKIGKFGVGFVSVFAIEPEGVVVDTSRDGESWRIVFHPDRSFTRIRLESAVGGTEVRLIKSMAPEAFGDFVRRSEQVLRYWCRYSEADIRFQGQPVNQTFDLDTPVKVRVKRSGTEVVAGLTAAPVPFFGLYNRGLTLVEGRQVFYPHVMFRIKSHYLEHTISRDNVIQDESFQKALGVVRDAVYEELYPALLKRIEQGETELLRYLPELFRDTTRRPQDLMTRELFLSVGGRRLKPRTLQILHWRFGELFYGSPDDAVAQALEARKRPVLRCGEDVDALAATVRAIVGAPPRQAARAFYLPVPQPVLKVDHQKRRFLSVLGTLLEPTLTVRPRVHLADLAYPGSAVADEIAVFARRLSRPAPMPPPRTPFESTQVVKHLLLNLHHPLIADAVQAAEHDPVLAAHIVARLMALHGLVSDQPAEKMLVRAMRHRRGPLWQRLMRRFRLA
ncbi:MAG: sacsin N-terminal ATP-binding-like domain-containing protein [Candidatus Xenobia bacterium]